MSENQLFKSFLVCVKHNFGLVPECPFCFLAAERVEMVNKLSALEARNRELEIEIERLKACPICHRPFVGKKPHINCGDTVLPPQNLQDTLAETEGE